MKEMTHRVLLSKVRSFKVIGTDMDQSDTYLYNFLLKFHCLCRIVSKVNCDFSRKLQIFPTPVYLTPPMKGFPRDWVTVLGVKELR